MRIILASKSEMRKKILQSYLPELEVIPHFAQEENFNTDIKKYVINNARIKAMEVAKSHPDCLVLGYDTAVYCEGKVYNKPKDIEEARKMLRAQRGKIEYICTGMCFVNIQKGIEIKDISITKVYFKYISDSAVEEILKDERILNCAGAYNYKLEGDLYIDIYEGEKENVVGLPLRKTLTYLQKIKVLKNVAI